MAIPVLSDVEYYGNKVQGAVLDRNKLGTTATEAGHLFTKEDFPHYRNESGVDVPLHDNSLKEIDADAESPLSFTTNGRVVNAAIALATALKAGILSAEHYALLAGATDLNIPGSLVLRGAEVVDSGGVPFQNPTVLGPTLVQGTLSASNITGLNTNVNDLTSATNVDFVQNSIQNALRDATANFDRKAQGVRVAVNTNTPLTSTFGSFDGVAIAAADTNKSILLFNQTNSAENGAYDVTANGLVRRADSNTEANLTNGASYQVETGTYANHIFTLVTQDGFTLNTDPLTFLDISGVNVLRDGNGISIVNQQINARTTIDRLVVNADGNLDISPAYDALVESKITTALETYGAVGERVFTFGDGVATEFTCTHNAGQRYPVVQGYYQGRKFEVNITSSSTTSFTFTASLGGTPVAADSITIVVHTDPAAANTSPSGEWIIAG